MPGNVARRFFALFRDLSRKEARLHEVVMPMMEQFGDAFYLLGSPSGDATMKHEVAHGFYYLDPAYRRDMDLITRGWRHAGQFKDALARKGYHASVARDETQAYMATSAARWLSGTMGFRPRPHPGYAEVFRAKWKDRLA